MSRLRRSRAVPLAFLLFLAASSLAPGAAPAAPVQGPVIEVQLYDFGIAPTGLTLDPGTNVTLHVTNKGAVPHNLYLDTGGALAKTREEIKGGEFDDITFAVPASGIIEYYCNVPGHHELGMSGNLTVRGSAAPPASAGGTNVHAIVGLGVNFYAYWVGVISFIVLFIVLAATFFLLRYGESSHWTDQRDRPAREPAKGEKPRSMMGTWLVLGLTLLVFVFAAYQVVRLG
jgi:plastocyanin